MTCHWTSRIQLNPNAELVCTSVPYQAVMHPNTRQTWTSYERPAFSCPSNDGMAAPSIPKQSFLYIIVSMTRDGIDMYFVIRQEVQNQRQTDQISTGIAPHVGRDPTRIDWLSSVARVSLSRTGICVLAHSHSITASMDIIRLPYLTSDLAPGRERGFYISPSRYLVGLPHAAIQLVDRCKSMAPICVFAYISRGYEGVRNPIMTMTKLSYLYSIQHLHESLPEKL